MIYKAERDDGREFTRLTISGSVNLESLLEALLALLGSPGFNYRTLLVYEQDTEFDLSEEDLRGVAAFATTARPANAPYGRTAVVAPRAVIFGLNRMYEVFGESIPAAFHVFRDIDEAIEWLQQVPAGKRPDDTP